MSGTIHQHLMTFVPSGGWREEAEIKQGEGPTFPVSLPSLSPFRGEWDFANF